MTGLAGTISAPYIGHIIATLLLAAALGGALGVIRPVRAEIIPRSSHVIHAQILLSVVGALIMIVVAESLASAFAIVGAAGLVRYRAQIKDPKDAGVMLVALAVGLAAGKNLYLVAFVGTVFVIGTLWLLESIEPPARSRFNLTIRTDHAGRMRPPVEHALGQKGVTFDLRGSSPTELHYEVTVPFAQDIKKLSKMLKRLDGHSDTSVAWAVKKYKTLDA